MQKYFVKILLSNLKDLPRLLSHVGLGSELQQSPGEAAGGFIILQLEEEVERGPEGEHLVHRLQVAVGEVGRHLAHADLQ